MDTDAFVIVTGDGIRKMTKAQVMEKLGISELKDTIEQLKESGSGDSSLSETAKTLILSILSECVYGTDQTANLTALENEFSNTGITEDTGDTGDTEEVIAWDYEWNAGDGYDTTLLSNFTSEIVKLDNDGNICGINTANQSLYFADFTGGDQIIELESYMVGSVSQSYQIDVLLGDGTGAKMITNKTDGTLCINKYPDLSVACPVSEWFKAKVVVKNAKASFYLNDVCFASDIDGYTDEYIAQKLQILLVSPNVLTRAIRFKAL